MVSNWTTAFVPPSEQCSCCAMSAPLLPAEPGASRAAKSKWPCLVQMCDDISRGTCLACVMRKSKCSLIDHPVTDLPISVLSAPPTDDGPSTRNRAILPTLKRPKQPRVLSGKARGRPKKRQNEVPSRPKQRSPACTPGQLPGANQW